MVVSIADEKRAAQADVDRMTIRDLESGKEVAGVLERGERGATLRKALARMSEAEVGAVRSALDARIEGSRIETSAWIPGSDWRGTPWQPIFDVGAKGSFELAALMFGLFVWEAFERHPADWFTTKFSAGGEEDRFRVYFRTSE